MTKEQGYFQEAINLYRGGLIEESLVVFDKAIQVDIQDQQAWFCKGLALGELERFSEAIEVFKEALELDPKDADVWSNLGLSYYNVEDFEAALIALDKAIELGLDSLELVLHYKALVLYQQCLHYEGGEPPMLKKTIIAFRDAIKASPEEGASRYFLADLFKHFGRFEDALETLEQLLEYVPESVQGWYAKGANLAILGRLDDAFDNIQKAAELDNIMAQKAWEDDDYKSLREREDFLLLVEEMAALDACLVTPGDEETVALKCNEAYMLLREGEKKRAFLMMEELTRSYPDMYHVWSTYGLSLFEESSFEKAADALKQALEIDSRDSGTWYTYAICLEELQENERALQAIKKALEDEKLPYLVSAWHLKARLLAQEVTSEESEIFKESKKAFDQVLRLEPTHEQAKLELGLLLLEVARYDDALKIFDEFIEKKGEIEATAYFFKAISHAQQDDKKAALDALEKASFLRPMFKEAASQEVAFQRYQNEPQFQKILVS